MKEGDQVLIVNPDSSFFGRQGKLVEITLISGGFLLKVDLGDKEVTFINHDVREVKED